VAHALSAIDGGTDRRRVLNRGAEHAPSDSGFASGANRSSRARAIPDVWTAYPAGSPDGAEVDGVFVGLAAALNVEAYFTSSQAEPRWTRVPLLS
jgi:hypothetical protein